jgi:hypothetical protein
MSYRSFWVRRFIQAGGYLPGAIPPVFDDSPFISNAFVGKQIGIFPGIILAGNPSPTITTEVINLVGSILPSTYIIQQGDQLRIKQTAVNSAGSAVTYSGWAYAVPEITGYTSLSPVTRNSGISLTSNTQPGSRIFYMSNSGVEPAQGEYYFWNGTAIIDSTGSLTGVGGVAYGSDWRNPAGPVKSWRHIAACMQTQAGLAPGIRSGDYGANAGSGTSQAGNPRIGYPDMWLFKRGDTFNLDTDYVDYKIYATGYTGTGSWIGLHGGADAYNLQVCCDYGATVNPRPRFIYPKNKAVGGATVPTNASYAMIPFAGKNVRYVGLHFDGHARDPDFTGQPVIGFWRPQPITNINIGFEDCRVDGMGFGDPTSANGVVYALNQVYFYRCTFTDAWAGTLNSGHISAIHSGCLDPGRLQIVDCRVARNGFKFINPARSESGSEQPAPHDSTLSYNRDDVVLYLGDWYVCLIPAQSGTSITNTVYWVRVTTDSGKKAYGTIFDRNLYLAGRTDMYDTLILRGASNEQWRSGGFIKNNFIQAGAVVISDWATTSEDEIQTSIYYKNVQQNVQQLSLHTSWGLMYNMGVHFSLAEYNLVTGAADEANGLGFYMASRHPNYQDTTLVYNRTRNNNIRNNLFSAGTGKAFDLYDGIPTGNTSNDSFAVFPSLLNNKLRNNSVITTSPISVTYTPMPVSPGTPVAPLTTDTVSTGNVAYTSRSAYASSHGGSEPSRTLKTYLQSVGITVNSIDGVHEMVGIFNSMDRNNWPAQYSAAAINTYIRQGMGFTVPV